MVGETKDYFLLRFQSVFDPASAATDVTSRHVPSGFEVGMIDKASIQAPYVELFVITQHLTLGSQLTGIACRQVGSCFSASGCRLIN